MKNSAFTFFTLIICFISLISPVNAGAIDNGVEMVAKGIDAYMELKTEKNLQTNFGVSYGDVNDSDDLTPSQKLVYMVGAAEQHPFEVKWVRDQFAAEFVWYYAIAVLVILILGILEILQRTCPEELDGLCSMFSGHSGNFDYSRLIKTTLLLGVLPIFALPILDFLLTLEQTFSSGLMKSSLEFISFSADSAGVYFFESIAYAICGWLFALRIQFINEFCANILIVILLLSIAWSNTKHFAVLFIAWFISALAMRPIVLWYSCKAVEHIANQETTKLAILVTPGAMKLVVFLSFVTALVLVLWPLLMMILKIVVNYIFGIVFKALRLYGAYNRARWAKK